MPSRSPRPINPSRLALTTLGLLACLGTGPGCSLPRAALGQSDADGAIRRDAGPGRDTGVPEDAALVDAPTPDDAAAVDAATVDGGPGTCNRDTECPADTVILGMCTYATPCSTRGSAEQTTTHYVCEAHVCVSQVSLESTVCERETDGDACGERSCDACDATACDATGSQRCVGSMCASGACVVQTTFVSCTTPANRCGNPPWGPCHGNIGSSTCTQERLFGRCVLGGCQALIGALESRDCGC